LLQTLAMPQAEAVKQLLDEMEAPD
jgi:hypothetical protein